jgi:uncharacterized protein (TIGR00251 family)
MADGRLKVRIQAAPVDGRANSQLISFLASILGMKKSQIRIETGFTTRDKRIVIEGLDQAELDRLLKLAPG